MQKERFGEKPREEFCEQLDHVKLRLKVVVTRLKNNDFWDAQKDQSIIQDAIFDYR